ncbi:MAG: putative spermidine/putrescine transport system substrate-binding protein [Rhodospirillaceae bacterium]|nr:putative spermidine/putrescine transport system substrate-binding protein [Rhodospirillaceae bacterium]
MITRRGFIGTVGAGALATTLPVMRLRAATRSLVFTSWGGTTQDAQKAAWADSFAKATGMEVLQDGPTDYGKLKAMVEAGNVAWDVVDVEGDFAYQAGQKGWLEPIDYSIVSKDALDPRFTFEYGVGSFYYSFVLAFNKDSFGGKTPETWADIFDTTKFPGKRSFWKWSSPGVLEMTLLADGVAADKLYPLDLDRAFAKLDSIKQDIVWWSSGAQSQQLLASGETPIGKFWNGRIYALQQTGANVGLSWNQNMALADILVVPKGTKNKQQAMEFLARATSAEGQAALANATAYAPINKDSVPLLDKKMLPLMPFEHTDSQVTLDLSYWAKNRDAIADRWYAWQAK